MDLVDGGAEKENFEMTSYEVFQLLVFPGFILLLVLAFFYEWIDRKFFARLQNRYGPLYAGPLGLFQPVADFVKLLGKEDIVPLACDKLVFALTPILYFVLPLTALFVVPISESTGLIAFEGDLIFVMFIFTMLVVTIFLAGWSSSSRFGIIGGVRAALQMLSYEIPLGLAMIGPAIAAGSLSISAIANWQASHLVWSMFLQPIGFAVLIIGLLAELEFVPFDIPEADTEIVAGWRTEFSGRKLALFRVGRDLELVLASAIVTALYLGGAQVLGPIPAMVSFLIKTVIVVLLLSFLRAVFARFRIDQMTAGMWKYLLPIAILQIVLVQFGIGR
jgi:NADH-quinone oxidoreductase subunit H